MLCAGALGARFAAQEPSHSVDFARDVQPILRQHCYSCHGPSTQQNGFRLDRRSDAMRGGSMAMIGPGNSEGSRLYLRLIGNTFGTQMPPTGALTPAQIAIIKEWIDLGAPWPDAPWPARPRASPWIRLRCG
jgi:mono/diheme cytochrome c family protein